MIKEVVKKSFVMINGYEYKIYLTEDRYSEDGYVHIFCSNDGKSIEIKEVKCSDIYVKK